MMAIEERGGTDGRRDNDDENGTVFLLRFGP